MTIYYAGLVGLAELSVNLFFCRQFAKILAALGDKHRAAAKQHGRASD
jgi:hypothetical protein